MIIKKLAAPLINDKILLQAEYCYIATSRMSEAGFDFINTRLTKNCKIDIVTGLDELTSPQVLKRIWRNYQGRINLMVYTRNVFHANVYIFDLPYRKCVAFVGTGSFTLEGIKDHEEVFIKIVDPKEIESLKSWFTGYYEFAEPLTEKLIQEYDFIYPAMKQHEIASRQEKQHIIEITTGSFNWDTINFKNQFFKKDDYLILANAKALLNNAEITAERKSLQTKIASLHESIKKHLGVLKLHEDQQTENIVTTLENNAGHNVRSFGVAYGRSKAALKQYEPTAKLTDFITLQIKLRQKDFGVWLIPGIAGSGKIDREYFKDQMQNEEYRIAFFSLLKDLGKGYTIEIAGDKKQTDLFTSADMVYEFCKADDWRYYTFAISKVYQPHDAEISTAKIVETITKDFDKLILLYTHMMHKH